MVLGRFLKCLGGADELGEDGHDVGRPLSVDVFEMLWEELPDEAAGLFTLISMESHPDVETVANPRFLTCIPRDPVVPPQKV